MRQDQTDNSPQELYEVLNEVVVDRGANPYLAKIECWERDTLITKVLLPTLASLRCCVAGVVLLWASWRTWFFGLLWCCEFGVLAAAVARGC